MPSIELRRVFVGGPAPIGEPSAGIVSAIAKRPVTAPELSLTELNLDGDDQADRTVHGGLDKAVYAYPSEHRAEWAAELDQPGIVEDDVAPFGENLSTIGATERDVRIGDRWHWGSALMEVCQPRWPCQKLTLHRGTASVGPMMRASARTGWYLRVLRTGVAPTAGSIEVEPHPAGVTVAEANDAMLDRRLDDRARVERLVALGGTLADEWRLPLVERLATP